MILSGIIKVKGEISRPFISLVKYTHIPASAKLTSEPRCRTGFSACLTMISKSDTF